MKTRTRKKGEAPRRQEIDPEILAALERITAETGQAEAKAILERMVEEGDLEIEEGADPESLVIPLARLLTRLRDAGAPMGEMATTVGEWLLEQEQVGDLFLDDEGLVSRLAGP